MIPILQIVADTLIVRQVTPLRTGFDEVVFVAAGLAQVVTLVVVVLLSVIFFRMWKAQQAMQEQLGRLTSKIDPMIASATAAAENVRELTDAVKQDAMAAAESLSNAAARVRDAVSGISDRIDDVGAVLGRVTEKAEAVADVAGAAVSTFKAGSRLFKQEERPHRSHEARPRREQPRREEPRREEPRREEPRPAAPPRHQEPPPAVEAASDEGPDEPIRLTDGDEGHESPYAEENAAPTARPRRRRNRRRRGGGGSGGVEGGAEGGTDGGGGSQPTR